MKKEYDFSKGKRGQVMETPGKTRITIYLDDDVLEEFRRRGDAAGRGYQTMINEALRSSLGLEAHAIDAGMLRRILREELHGYASDRLGAGIAPGNGPQRKSNRQGRGGKGKSSTRSRR